MVKDSRPWKAAISLLRSIETSYRTREVTSDSIQNTINLAKADAVSEIRKKLSGTLERITTNLPTADSGKGEKGNS